jgi:hypothetical protein
MKQTTTEEAEMARWEYINGESGFVTVDVEGWRRSVSGNTSVTFEAGAAEEMAVHEGTDSRKLVYAGTVGDLCYPAADR